MYASPAHSFYDFLVRHSNLDNEINGNIRFAERFSLGNRPRKTVKQKPPGTVIVRDTLFDELDDDVVGHQRARVHDSFYAPPERRALLNGGAEHVSGRNLRNIKRIANELCLGALSRTRWSYEYDSHTPFSLLFCAITRRTSITSGICRS